jgi:hypothetical protein
MSSARLATSSARYSIDGGSKRIALDKPERGANSYLPMSLTDWFWPKPRSRALGTIGSIAASYRMLSASLERHAAACSYPTIRAGLQKLSAAKSEQAESLSKFLASEENRPSAPSVNGVDGASNWQRLKADLALESQLLRELNQAIAQLEGRQHQAAGWLRDFAGNEERCLGDLRDLVLKCDTYALD